MLDAVTMHYLNSKFWAIVGAALAGPSTIFAMVEGERVTLFLAIAGGVLAFLWGCRKYPMEQRMDDATKALNENHQLREDNTRLAEQNERLRIRLAHEEESGNYPKPEKRD